MRVPRIWSRFAVMTYNVLTALKRLALPEKWLIARPKRMRFQTLLARQTGFACAPDLVASAATEGSVGRVDQWIETPRLPIPLRA